MKKTLTILFLFTLFLWPAITLAQADFNPQFIISDKEMFDYAGWTIADIQKFLEARGSYLAKYQTEDINGNMRTAAGIIFDAAQIYQVNPKYLLVTLQKEQSLITDDSPAQKQLDWATGYAVCDSCDRSDPKVAKHKGFAKQVDDAAGIMRWYYENKDQSFIKKKDTLTMIDNIEVVPQSWATAFLYTYTPHLHGNKNFWRIWQTWFSQNYPNGTLVKISDTNTTSTDFWLIQDGKKRKFKNFSVLISRADPNMVISVAESELTNYETGPDIVLPNYSILKTELSQYYLIDYDTLRPFASEETVRQLGYNPDEIVDISSSELIGYENGPIITTSSTPPLGIIYQITDLNNKTYLLKDNNFYPITEKNLLASNYKNIPIEKHKKKDLAQYPIIYSAPTLKDGLLLKEEDSNQIYVMENNKKRPIADEESFGAMGYKKENLITINSQTLLNIDDGEKIFVNASLLNSKDKYLGDSEAEIEDLYGSKLPAYLVAEYPSGRIVSGKNIDTKRPMASLTKLITALSLLNQKYKPETVLVYSNKKYGVEGGNLALKDGDKIKVKDAFAAMLVGSANNTSRMLAQNSGVADEKSFIKIMNKNLDTWGMDNTKVADVTGLDEKNQSTPRDILKIFIRSFKNETIKKAVGQTSYKFKEVYSKDKISTHTIKNTNKLTQQAGNKYKIIASKTGYTEEAGSNLIMLIQNNTNKKQYVIITMGNPDYKNRFKEPNNIGNWVATSKTILAKSQ
jgi:D-alanyl-D-alanine endopeptidase (penicillin-binding protein 7)